MLSIFGPWQSHHQMLYHRVGPRSPVRSLQLPCAFEAAQRVLLMRSWLSRAHVRAGGQRACCACAVRHGARAGAARRVRQLRAQQLLGPHHAGHGADAGRRVPGRGRHRRHLRAHQPPQARAPRIPPHPLAGRLRAPGMRLARAGARLRSRSAASLACVALLGASRAERSGPSPLRMRMRGIHASMRDRRQA